MSKIILSKIESPYYAGDRVDDSKVFICTKCKNVVVNPQTNIHWGTPPFTCIQGISGCKEISSMICIKDYHGPSLEERSDDTPTQLGWICHPDFFSISKTGWIYLETDLSSTDRESLTDYINKKIQKTDNNSSLIAELKKKNPEELVSILSFVFSK